MADTSKITVNNITYNIKDSVARDHIANRLNPHNVTKAQVGLGNVDNTSDANKAVFESRLLWGGTNIAGDISPIDAAMSNIHSANRAAFANPAGIIIEFSNDGGSTWTDYGASDTSKIQLVSGIETAYFIGKHTTNNTVTVNDKLRITVNASTCGFYTNLKKILINVSTNGAGGAYVELQKSYKGTETSWSSSVRYSVSGWSGWNSIPCSGSFGGGSNQTGNMANIRLTFGITSKGSSSYTNSLSVQALQFLGTTYWGYHSEMAKSGHLYSYDAEQNASFPAQITAKQFNGTATNASKVNNHTVNSDVPSGAKFTDTTYSAATTSADGLMSTSDKKAVDREFFRMLPKGGTHIPAKADLNSIEYIKVGNYYNSLTAESGTIKNIPTNSAFMMYVLSPLSETYDNESTAQWVYRLRIFVEYTGNKIFVQTVFSGATAGTFTYDPWVKMTNSNDLIALSKIINDHIANKSNPHGVTKAQVGLGSVANLDQSKAIKSITRSGTTFTATALDGTKTTFTQQDTNTTYGVATSSADGLMSKSDKVKLDGIDPSAITKWKLDGEILVSPSAS